MASIYDVIQALLYDSPNWRLSCSEPLFLGVLRRLQLWTAPTLFWCPWQLSGKLSRHPLEHRLNDDFYRENASRYTIAPAATSMETNRPTGHERGRHPRNLLSSRRTIYLGSPPSKLFLYTSLRTEADFCS